MFPMNLKPTTVTVEYRTKSGELRQKTFPTATLARSFFVRKDREGANPRILSAVK